MTTASSSTAINVLARRAMRERRREPVRPVVLRDVSAFGVAESSGIFMETSGRLIADDDAGGLHAFGVDFFAVNLARATPRHVNQLGIGDGAGGIKGEIIAGHAGINMKGQRVTVRQ